MVLNFVESLGLNGYLFFFSLKMLEIFEHACWNDFRVCLTKLERGHWRCDRNFVDFLF